MSIKTVFTKLGNTVLTKTKKPRLHFKKHAPAYLTGGGIVGLGVTAYLSYKAGKTIEEVITKAEADEKAGLEVDRKEVRTRVIKASIAPVAVGAVSAGMIFGSYRILSGRLASVATAYAISQRENARYREYIRKNVPEGVAAPIGEREEVLASAEEEGKKKPQTETVYEQKAGSILEGFWLDRSAQYASDNIAYNLAYIESQARKLNNKRATVGYITVADVASAFEIKDLTDYEKKAAVVSGWDDTTYFDIETTIIKLKDDFGYPREVPYVSFPKPANILNHVVSGRGDLNDYAY